jgi:hypothetical protein
VDQTVATSTPSTSPAAPVDSLSDGGSVASIAPHEPDTLPGRGSLSSVGPIAPIEWVAPETTAEHDALGRHSLGRTHPAEADGPLTEALTVSSMWARPDLQGDRTPAPAPTPVAVQSAPVAPLAPAVPSVALVMTLPAEGGAPEQTDSTPSVPRSSIAADWYPDASNRTRLRYWDGAGWTVYVLDDALSHRAPAAGPPQ